MCFFNRWWAESQTYIFVLHTRRTLKLCFIIILWLCKMEGFEQLVYNRCWKFWLPLESALQAWGQGYVWYFPLILSIMLKPCFFWCINLIVPWVMARVIVNNNWYYLILKITLKCIKLTHTHRVNIMICSYNYFMWFISSPRNVL